MAAPRTWISSLLLAITVASLAGCGASGNRAASTPAAIEVPSTALASDTPADAAFHRDLDVIYRAHLEYRPATAINLGLHAFDGRVPDRSAAAITAETERLKAAKATLEGHGAAKLSPTAELERQVMLAEVHSELFELEVLRSPFKNPMNYANGLDVSAYVTRNYAPVEQRARAVIAVANSAKQYFANARANLEASVPAPWNDTALLITSGGVDFVKKDVPAALAGITDAKLQQELDAALATLATEIAGYHDFLESRKGQTTNDYALGAERFMKMLAETQDINTDLASLERLAQADLDRNVAAIEAAAKQLDPKKPAREVIAAAANDKPAADQVLAVATDQATDMRKFLVDKSIVSIPFPDEVTVAETPSFMRWNQAFLEQAGAFESKPLPSFYYISPPDPKWPEAEQKAYILARPDMLFTTIHEVWPGHFLHGLHIKKQPSPVLRTFCTYTMVEGWAHYTEEMMWLAGAGGGEPKYHIGQLKEALLRNARFVSAIGLHTKGWTVEQATKVFEEKGFVDKASARQQAIRGTFDPMYVSYTLGKLMIMKLAGEWKTREGEKFTLEGFHDRFLDYACAPIPVIRQGMLGPDAGTGL